MAKYKEKIPVVYVEIDEWHPANGKNHPMVVSAIAEDGRVIGRIHALDSTVQRRDGQPIELGDFIVTYPGKQPKYAVFEPHEVDAYFDRVVEEPATPALPADSGAELLKKKVTK